ncbi:hypothetical protein ASE00_14935 [Sphingomonas sp. Root710]|uniref:hypothetical protein n=1 Tax=Sphingomonas sp. Root710 TaxID=1736594 RepID=UPI0006F64D6C|nr:hypothetical protein [Sphingomonas sp. Root710]KRB81286.1 hypothetical protein ASE00_14935 [Sphingomonas sp. Root710]
MANLLQRLLRDESGKLPVKLVFGSCVLAIAVATSSPAFEANPLISKTIYEMRQHLPATLDTITRAMGG